MMRYLEYVYLLVAVGIAVFMAVSFKELSLGSKVLMSFAAMLCSFMYSFRRKQRAMMEEFEEKEGREEEVTPPQNPDDHGE